MPCYDPIPAYQDEPKRTGSEWTKPPPVLWPQLGTANLSVPCGTCIGCKSQRATMWAQRCSHEASQWENNVFVTLTYADDHLPRRGYLDAVALTKFFKRLRKRAARSDGRVRSDPARSPRYLACGEYGEDNGRPHYHACIFNLGFAGPGNVRRVGKDLYEADELARLWPFGAATFGPFEPGAANYVAKYTLKRQPRHRHLTTSQGYEGVGHREDIDYETGEVIDTRKPAPFLRMSLRPAIGLAWLEKYQTDLQHGYLVSNGHRHAIPRTYRERLKLQNPQLKEDIDIRTAERRKPPEYNDPERRKAAEVIHRQQLARTQRKL